MNSAFRFSLVLVSVMLVGGQAAQQTPPIENSDHAANTQNAEPNYPEPTIPDGVTLDEILDNAAKPPPASWPQPVDDNAVYSFTLFELLEYRVANTGDDEFGWDAQGWIGNDDRKFWWKTEGDALFNGADSGDADIQALYALPISAFWYFQAGVRYEETWQPAGTDEHFSAVLGVQGIAPYKFDLEPAIYLTDEGDALAEFTASYDLYLTQRLVLQPRVNIFASAQDIPESGLGAGVNSGRFDLRLRYEIHREFAPYIGVSYSTLFGETADIAARNGEDDHDLLFLFGVRIAI